MLGRGWQLHGLQLQEQDIIGFYQFMAVGQIKRRASMYEPNIIVVLIPPSEVDCANFTVTVVLDGVVIRARCSSKDGY